ncbi:MAG: hypothetical protein WBV82_20700 [Myxococcaceae bacterium]
MRAPLPVAVFFFFVFVASSSAFAQEANKPVIVIAAPGYPGTPAEAQPTMDSFAASVAKAAGWAPGSLGAQYENTEQGGVSRLSEKNAAMALVPLPFWVEHGKALGLEPKLEVVMQGSTAPTETWTLVAKKGRVTSPASLEGFTVASTAGYAPGFVRGALAGWGTLPESVKVTESRQVLSQLRKAASGANVVVLLDGTQAASLASLPFASELEVVAKSEPLPVAFVTTVDQHLPAAKLKTLEQSMLKASSEGVLKTLRMERFVPVDPKALAAAKQLAGTAK